MPLVQWRQAYRSTLLIKMFPNYCSLWMLNDTTNELYIVQMSQIGIMALLYAVNNNNLTSIISISQLLYIYSPLPKIESFMIVRSLMWNVTS